MHREPRVEPIEKLVVHVNVGPEVEGGAAGLASYLNSQDGGYHVVHDDKVSVVTAQDDQVVWGASYMNARGKHHCLIGQASQTAADWADVYSKAEIERLAQALAVDCKKYSLPAIHLNTVSVHTPGVKGICGHIDVTNAFKEDGIRDGIILDHWDPGPNFPWSSTMARVQAILDGTGTTTTEEEMKPTDLVTAVMGLSTTRFLLTRDGGIQSNPADSFLGSLPQIHAVCEMGVSQAVDMLMTPTGKGYWIVTRNGWVFSFGDATWQKNFTLDVGPAAGLGVLSLFPNGSGYRAIREDLALLSPR